jgi:hypothetical protein
MGADDDVIYNLNVELGELTEELTGNREQYEFELSAVRQRMLGRFNRFHPNPGLTVALSHPRTLPDRHTRSAGRAQK